MKRTGAGLFSLLLAACAPPAGPADLVITGAAIVEVETGAVIHGKAVVVDQGRVRALVDDDAAPPARTVLDGAGGYLIPGLWDMHAHISDKSFFPLFVDNGVVGVRDMGGALAAPADGCGSIDISVLSGWRDDIRAGKLVGPRIVLAGPVLSGSPAPGGLSAATPQDARNSVQIAAAAGADFIKVYEDIPPDALLALAEEARAQGLPFAGHVSEETLTVIEAIEAGQRSIEHVRSHLLLCFAETEAEREALFISDDWDAEDRLWASRHIAACPAIWTALREGEVWLTPTLGVQETMIAGAEPGFEDDPRRNALPQSIRDAVAARSARQRTRSDAETEEASNWNRFIDRFVARAGREDARLLAGSDAACEGVIPGHGLHRELELMVAAGLSPLRALQSATLEPARYFGRVGETGLIAQGADADLVLLRGDPIADISAVREIDAVILRGEIVAGPDKPRPTE